MDNLVSYEKKVTIMQNSVRPGGIALMERARQSLRAHRMGAAYLGYILVGFVSANAFVLGGLAPFGVAFASAAKAKYAAAATLGAALGYLLSFDVMGNIKYVIAMLLVFLIRWGLSTSSLTKWTRVSRQLICAVSLGTPSLAITFVTGGSVYDAVLGISEVMLACCASYFFSRTIEAFDLGIDNLKQTDITSILITFCIIILALINLTVFGLSIGRVLAVTVILLAAQFAREAGGAIAGVAAGVAAGILGGSHSFLMGTYGFGGLLAGVFAPLGRLASAGAFILVNLFALLASRAFAGQNLLVEIFIAGVIVMLIPPRLVQSFLHRAPQGEAVAGETYKALLANRIGYVSQALREVADTTRQVNEKLSGLVSGDVSSVYQCAADQICRDCARKTTCWQLKYTDTCNIFNDMITILRRKGAVTLGDYPEYFSAACQHLPELNGRINQLFCEFAARESMRRKVAQVRGVVTDQFEGMALMIDSMGRELDGLATQDNATAGKVREYMHTMKVFPDRVSCVVDGEANMTLEMTIPVYKLTRLDMTELTLTLSDICGRDFDLPSQRGHAVQTLTTLVFTEKATYTVKWGATQLGNSSSRLCGDSYSYVDSRTGHVNLILSDGMGSGGAAAVDSTMTAELLKRLIEAGVSLDAALKLVNSALLVKSGDESLATIDITGIDLYTGKVEFYKAGAAPTFLRKSGKGGYVESSSLPVGILGGVSFERNAITLRDGDWIVMVSDGAVASGYEWIISDIEHFEGDDPKELSERLAAAAKCRRSDGHEDDITVIAALLERGI
ncbi:SpoIIE family protein phosphatase [Anaerotruncus rubiinfantis]|uniref:SpoIIE family protein phosphatase n=1 Tax=Anaerotruncus rubiinfantis TaxID=1720200 RepID=UPI00082CE371|nr:SpoIIE family protein phosphatase [Anaerotruncus rubiinfantis]